MQNVLLLFCRRTRHFSQKELAARLGITTEAYRELESGKTLLTESQARRLGKLYNAPYKYFYEAAQQLDFLLTTQVNLKILKSDNDRLWERLLEQENTSPQPATNGLSSRSCQRN